MTSEAFPFKKVLVIDDNPMDRYLAEMVMKLVPPFAREIVLKPSAKSGLEYLASLALSPDKLPELIFLDIRMPELDGFAFLEMYNNLPEIVQKKCIIMMLTSSLNTEDRQRASESHFVKGYLNKPLTKDKLTQLIVQKNVLVEREVI